jgi:hypothetical protein
MIPLAVDLGKGPIDPPVWLVIALVASIIVFWLSIVACWSGTPLRRDDR